MEKYFLILVFIFCCKIGSSQYDLQVKTNQTYNEITDADFEVPDSAPFWGNVSIKPDFNFNAFGSAYDFNTQSVFIPVKQGYAYFINNTRSTTIYASRGDFVARKGQNQTSMFSYQVAGLGGERGLLLQWKNMGFADGDSSDFINFQILLFEKSGNISIRIGDVNVKNNIWENNANGPIIGLLEMDNTFSTIFNRTWLTGDAQSPVETKTGTFLALNSTPQKGTTYTFSPKTTSVSEIANNGDVIKAYPTVITHQTAITIKSEATAKNLTVKLYNTVGQLLKTEVVSSNNHQMQLPEMQSGIYVLQFEKEGKVIGKSKLVK